MLDFHRQVKHTICMDRFSGESPAEPARSYAASLFGEEASIPDVADAGDENSEPECPVRAEIIAKHFRAPISEYLALLNAHETVCVFCQTTEVVSRKEVSSENRSEAGPMEDEVA